MEFLKVFFHLRAPYITNAVVAHWKSAVSTRNLSTTTTNFNEPSVLAYYAISTQLTTSGAFAVEQPYCYDMTDGAGHGMLVGTDNIYLQLGTVGSPVSTAICDVKILYRFKQVTLSEYIGIVQSQQ
jgi:hypothetical protein